MTLDGTKVLWSVHGDQMEDILLRERIDTSVPDQVTYSAIPGLQNDTTDIDF